MSIIDSNNRGQIKDYIVDNILVKETYTAFEMARLYQILCDNRVSATVKSTFLPSENVKSYVKIITK